MPKVAVVTGAAQGLGFTTAILLARRGYVVVATDVQPLDRCLAQMAEKGFSAQAVRGDVASEAFAIELAARLRRDYGAADVLVNNAGTA